MRMMIHAKKILPEYFSDVLDGLKKFEVRKDDCNYKVGDQLALNEWADGNYTGRSVLVQITYRLDLDDFLGTKDNWVVLGFEPILIEKQINIEEFPFSASVFAEKMIDASQMGDEEVSHVMMDGLL